MTRRQRDAELKQQQEKKLQFYYEYDVEDYCRNLLHINMDFNSGINCTFFEQPHSILYSACDFQQPTEGERERGHELFHSAVVSVCRRRERYKYFFQSRKKIGVM